MSDRIPPHNLDFEQGLIGSLILSPKDALWEFVSRYPEGERFFYDLRNANVFKAIVNLANTRRPVDIATILAELGAAGAVTPEHRVYVASLPDATPSGYNADYYAKELARLYQQRRLIQTCATISQRAYAQDHEALAYAEQEILNIGRNESAEDEVSAKDLAVATIAAMDAAYQNRGKVQGVPTGFPLLDKRLRGLKPGQMFVIGARPAQGKTALAMNIADHAAVKCGIPTGVFSLEMTKEELFKRMLCARAGVSSDELDNADLNTAEQQAASDAIAALSKAPLHIQDPSGISIHILAARARRMAHRHGIRLLIVDYLQLLRGTRTQNRTVEITEVSNMLKCLAKELKVPLIVLAQLNRESERDGNREPKLSDLRDSGSIEQDADIVALIHTKDSGKENSNIETDLLIRKHRNGPTGRIPLLFRRSITRFEQV